MWCLPPARVIPGGSPRQSYACGSLRYCQCWWDGVGSCVLVLLVLCVLVCRATQHPYPIRSIPTWTAVPYQGENQHKQPTCREGAEGPRGCARKGRKGRKSRGGCARKGRKGLLNNLCLLARKESQRNPCLSIFARSNEWPKGRGGKILKGRRAIGAQTQGKYHVECVDLGVHIF